MASSVRPAPIRPAMPTISPLADREVDVLAPPPGRHGRGDGRSSSRTSSSGVADLRLARRIAVRHVAPDHALDDAILVDRARCGSRASRPCVPSRRMVIWSATLEISLSLCEIRIDEMPCALKPSSRFSSASLSLLVQAGGRLVEDQQLDLLGQRLGDLDELLLADAEIGDQRLGILVEADHRQQLAGRARRRGPSR